MKYLLLLLPFLACDNPFAADPIRPNIVIDRFHDCVGIGCALGEEIPEPQIGEPFVAVGKSKYIENIRWRLEWSGCRNEESCPDRTYGPFNIQAEREHFQPMGIGGGPTWIILSGDDGRSFVADSFLVEGGIEPQGYLR